MADSSLDWLYSASPFDQSKVNAGVASQQPGADGRTILAGQGLLNAANTIAAPKWVPASTSWQSMGDGGDVSQLQNAGYFVSSNGTILNSPDGGQTFTDNYNNPSTGSSKDQASVTYRLDGKGGAVPISTSTAYAPSDWTNTYRPVGEILGSVLAAGAGGAALAGAGVGGDAAAAGAAGAAAGGSSGLSSADLAFLYGDTGYGAGAGTAAAGAGAGGGLSSAELSALYSNAGYGSTTGAGSFGSSVLSGAGKGALMNGLTTAARGGGIGDILKGAATGAVTGGFGGAVSSINPAGYAGISNPALANGVNGAVTSGSIAAATGGNVGQAVGGSLFSGGINAATNYAMGQGGAATPSGGNGMSYNFDSGTPSGNYFSGFPTDSPPATVDPNASYTAPASTSPYTGQSYYDTSGNPFTSALSGGSGNLFSALGSVLTGAGSSLTGQAGGPSLASLISAGLGLYGANQTRNLQAGALQGAQAGLQGQLALAQDQWNYEKNTFLPAQQARSDAAFALTQQAAQQQMANSADYQNMSDQSFNQAKKSWEFQNDYMGLANDYLSGKAGNTFANVANADVNQQYADSQSALNRNAQRMGLNPGSGAFVSNMYDLANQRALAGAGAQSAAYLAARNKAEQMVGIAAGSGTAGFGTGLSAGGLATNAASAAGNLTNSGVNNGNNINNSLSGGVATANSGFGSNTSGWNSLAQTAVNTGNPFTSIGSGLGNGLTTSTGSMQTPGMGMNIGTGLASQP